MRYEHDLPLKAVIGTVLALSTLAIGYAVYADHKAKIDLIASGTCQIDRSEWYTPPSDMVCTWRNGKGRCDRWSARSYDPYLRHHYSCPGKSFWFRDQPKKD